MIKSLLLKFGETPDRPPLTLPIGSAVVIVGPNNSGKSRLLQELEDYIRQKPRNTDKYLILKDVEAELPSNPELRKELTSAIQAELPKAAFMSPSEPLLEEASLPRFLMEIIPKASELIEAGKLFLTPELASLGGKLNSLILPLLLDPKQAFETILNTGTVKEEELQKKVQPHVEDATRILQEALKAGVQFLKDLRERSHAETPEAAILHAVQGGRIRLKPYLSMLATKTVRLDGRQRLHHVEPTPLPREDDRQNNHLARLLWNDDARRLLRKIVHEAFEYYLSIDISSFRKTLIKMSPEPPEPYEHSVKPEALEYFRRAQDIDSFSDGVKSFVGLLAALLSDEYLVMLIDEPEAFLHPPLARRLGQQLHQLARARGAHVLAATHSADFLMGCLQAAPDVHIVRLTYRQGVPTARVLPGKDLQQMMQDPLLRSTGTLGALFHEGALVCEGDRDRAFYQEVNERLLSHSESKDGAAGCMFINAHSKQSIRRVIGLLRKMGIPAAAVIDLDVLIDENVLKELLIAIGADSTTIDTLGMAKGVFYRSFMDVAPGEGEAKKTKAKALLKSQGLNALPEPQRRSMETLFFNPLALLGIFIVPGGEVESWLAYLLPNGTRPAKQDWLTTVFSILGSDPDSEGYVLPQEGDVWEFMRKIAQWVGDPKRRGMPS